MLEFIVIHSAGRIVVRPKKSIIGDYISVYYDTPGIVAHYLGNLQQNPTRCVSTKRQFGNANALCQVLNEKGITESWLSVVNRQTNTVTWNNAAKSYLINQLNLDYELINRTWELAGVLDD